MADGHSDATINQYFIYSLDLFTLCLPRKNLILIFADTKKNICEFATECLNNKNYMSMIKEKVLCRLHCRAAIGRLLAVLLVLMMASPTQVRAQILFDSGIGDNWNDPLNPGPSILPDFDGQIEDASEWEYSELKTYSFSGGDGTEKIRI